MPTQVMRGIYMSRLCFVNISGGRNCVKSDLFFCFIVIISPFVGVKKFSVGDLLLYSKIFSLSTPFLEISRFWAKHLILQIAI
jgi:hypothetical protein